MSPVLWDAKWLHYTGRVTGNQSLPRQAFPDNILHINIEEMVLARGIPVSAQILKVPHHGSKYSSSASFLSAVQPSDAVISVGTNSYGHPAPETLSRLQAVAAWIWRTDQSGTVVVTDDGSTYSLLPSITDYFLFLPVIQRSLPPTPIPPPLTPTASPPPAPMPGYNVACQQYGTAQICGSVSNPNPARYTTVTVYGRLVVNGVGQANQTMNTTWYYKTTTSSCSGTTGPGGLAECSRYISGATAGYQVNVGTTVAGYGATTWFTPY